MPNGKRQKIKVMFDNNIDPINFLEFRTNKFSCMLQEFVSPEQQKAVVRQLVIEGFISAKK